MTTDTATDQLACILGALKTAGYAVCAVQITTRVGKRSISVAVEVADMIEAAGDTAERRH